MPKPKKPTQPDQAQLSSPPPSVTPEPLATTSSPALPTALQLQLVVRPELPTLWADHVRFVVFRSSATKEEAHCTISFFHRVDIEATGFETARIQTSPELARRIIDIMAKNLNYYPTKPEPEAAA